MILHAAILTSARWLVPAPQRAEWFAEWDAELCYIRRARDSCALRFCLGAYKDAFWLRRQCPYRVLDSPLRCLALLALIAAISLVGTGRAAFSSWFRDARGLVELTDTPVEQYEEIWKNARSGFAGFAFFQRVNEPIRTPRGMALYSIVQGTGNLFQVLNVPVVRPAPARSAQESGEMRPLLIVSRDIWRMDFGNDRRIAGHYLVVGGRRVPVAGVIAEDAWPLEGRVDAWLLEDQPPQHAVGSVVGRVAASALAPGVLPRPARRFRQFIGLFVMAMTGALIVAVITAFKLGVAPGVRPRAFLIAKCALIVPTAYCCALLGLSLDMPWGAILQLAALWGNVCAFRWAVADQRKRCPVCLRFLSRPVLLGKASQTFLGWYGTERMCGKGHGVLRVPELATSCAGLQEWVNLEELCAQIPM
jgi:hypothetical protein